MMCRKMVFKYCFSSVQFGDRIVSCLEGKLMVPVFCLILWLWLWVRLSMLLLSQHFTGSEGTWTEHVLFHVRLHVERWTAAAFASSLDSLKRVCVSLCRNVVMDARTALQAGSFCSPVAWLGQCQSWALMWWSWLNCPSSVAGPHWRHLGQYGSSHWCTLPTEWHHAVVRFSWSSRPTSSNTHVEQLFTDSELFLRLTSDLKHFSRINCFNYFHSVQFIFFYKSFKILIWNTVDPSVLWKGDSQKVSQLMNRGPGTRQLP